MLLIIAIAWIYVVLMMSIAEHSVIAGIMTFLGYCVLPLTIVLYLLATPQRRRGRKATLTGAPSLQPSDCEQSINASETSSTPTPADISAGIRADADIRSGAAPGQHPGTPE